ncbi:MAG: hypothetical protein IPP47_33815 [Bryobacterales bacterium]|nr:hypothetical protein [Bryobacterales bacterium]
MTHTGAISRLIEQGRRRTALQLVLDQFGWGATACLAAFIVLLLVGTQVLDWYWPVLLLIVTVAIGWWRSRNRLPGEYQVAQKLDEALSLKDLISTAFHYQDEARRADPAFVQTVAEQAEQAASTADARVALPIYVPRGAWAATAMFAVAATLFFARYGILRTFDLSAPIATISFDTLTGAPKAVKKQAQLAQKTAFPDPFNLSVPESELSNVDEKDIAMQESLRTMDVMDPNKAGRQGQKGEQSAAQDDEQSEDTQEGESAAGDKKQSPAGAKDGRRPGDQDPKQKQGPPQKDGGLMDKMRDALANLMDKMNIEPKGGEQKQSASNKDGQKGQGQKKEKGDQQGKPNEQGEPDASQPGQQQADSDSAQQAKSNQPGNSPEQASKTEKSGVGKQDGKKDTELAEQQKAMGKLSELLGKRSLNMQGEVMVEVTNSKNQQLKTPYVTKSASHVEAGGEVSRDEVPLHLQDYVQRYYDKVRKPAAPANKQ